MPMSGASGLAAIDVDVGMNVPNLQQPSDNACWATCYTMMRSARDAASYDIRQSLQEVDRRAGTSYTALFDADNVLPWAQTEAFARNAGLATEPAMNYTVDAWAGFLSKYGPVWLSFYPGPTPPTGPTHMVLMTHLYGDGTPGGTTVEIADPAIGARRTMTFQSFAEQFELRVVRTNIPYPQVLHW
jgi:hypothetical protein